jgi:hypothetical protein
MMTTTNDAASRERRFDRASWLAVTFVLGFAAVCATVAALVLHQPGDGCLTDLNSGTTIFACVGDWETPLLPGDRIVTVAGLTIGGDVLIRGEHDRLTAQATAASLPYVVERDGATITLSVPLGRLDGQGILRAFGAGLMYYTFGWLYFIFVGATVIFALAPRARATQLLLIASGSGVAVVTLAWSADGVGANLLAPMPLYVGLVVLATFWGWLLMPTLLLLVLSFPRRVWPLARWPRATPVLLYGLPLAALVASLITGLSEIYLASLGLGALAFLVATIVVTTTTYRRVRDPVVRAQTAWLCLGLLLGIGIWPLLFVFGSASAPPAESGAGLWLTIDMALQVVTSVVFAVCLGIAITRYRLFDIEVVIRRTAVYGALTATLAAVYLAAVALAQSLVRAMTGQESDLAVVVATLTVAALFQPLRARIQAFIDRRFFRRKYDAAAVLSAHAAVVRDEVNVDQVTAALVGTVQGTLQPASIAVWVRDTGAER